MKRFVGIALVALGVAGCQASKPLNEMSYTELMQVAGQIHQRCLDQGVPDQTQQMADCRKIEANREIAMRQGADRRQAAAAAAVGNGLQSVSQGYYNAAAASRASMTTNQSINCTSRPMGAGTYSMSCN